MTTLTAPPAALRRAALAAAAVLTSLLFLACVPLLLDQTGPPRQQDLSATVHRVRLLPPQRTQELVREQEIPPPPPPPEPQVAAVAPDLPSITPPAIEAPAPPCPQTITPTPALSQAAAVRIAVPPGSAATLQNLLVAPAPPAAAAAMNLAAEGAYRFNPDEVDRQPESVSAMQPLYPYQARRLGIEGYVTVRFLVSRAGTVGELTILEAKPTGVFEQTVQNTVRRWRFKPARKNGRAVETWIKTSIEFKLQDAS